MVKKIKKTNKKVVTLPSFYSLCAKTWQELVVFWRSLGGVVAVYAVLYFILVLGFNLVYSYQDIADAIYNQLGGDPGWFYRSSLTVISLFTFNSQSDASAIMQFVLFLIATLAFIWTLRQLRTLKKIRMRDAYFDGTARIVPAIFVAILLFVPLLPMAIGSAVLSVVKTSGAIEPILMGLAVAGLFFVSFYWLVAWLPSIYVVSLPKGTPIAAIKSAAKLTKGSRFWMMRNIFIFAVLTIAIVFGVMLLFVSIVPQTSVVAAYITSFIVFGIVQTFLFTMYRGLLDES